MTYTEEEREHMYDAGEYVFAVPPVQTFAWNRAAWISWVTACDGWRPPIVAAELEAYAEQERRDFYAHHAL